MKAINKYLLVLTVLLCSRSICIAQDQTIWLDSLDSYTPVNIQYDTLEDIFLYEMDIRGYADNDVFMKGGNSFVKQSIPFNKSVYQNGYFIFRNDYLKKIATKEPLIHYDSTSLDSALKGIYEKYREGLVNIDSSFNPAYGCYYKKFRLKIEVLYLGSLMQRIPLFANNEKEMRKYVRKNNGRDYEIVALPTYLITRVFEWEEL